MSSFNSNTRSIAPSAPTIRRTPARLAVAVAAAAISVFVAAPAKADPVIQAGGSWPIVQGNGFYLKLNLSQNGSDLTGSATASHGQYADPVLTSGKVKGTVTASHIHLEIPWTPGDSVGIYDGDSRPTIDGDGRIYFVGNTCDQAHPTACASWHADWSFAQP
jgi:hypothetical protein